jgi:hypothetical protein
MTTLIVCGLGRCGTSMMMQMLAAGGMPVQGRWPAFEVDNALPQNMSADWLVACNGSAIKLIDPHRFEQDLRAVDDLAFILMQRDLNEQAASALKFMGVHGTRDARRKMSSSLRTDLFHTRKMLRYLQIPTIAVSFEKVLRNPMFMADVLAEYVHRTCGVELDPVAMSQAVVRRSPKNYPGIMELGMIGEGGAA